MKNLCLLLVSLIAVGGCALAQPSTDVADLMFINGKIYTVYPGQPWAEAVAIKGGKFIFVGSTEDAGHYRGKGTEVIDLHGKMAMPGLNDLHVHPVYGYTVKLYECTFPPTSQPDDVAKTVAACAARNPDAKWIVGGNWETDFFVKHDIKSPKKWLDKVSGGKAVLLRDSSFHNYWANSKALELAGIDRNTPDVKDGEIVRDKDTGEPNGLLYEGASDLVHSVIPDWTPAQYQRAALEGVKAASRFGMTGFKEAWASIPIVKAYKAVEQAGDLHVHLAVAISVQPFLDKDKNLDIEKLNQVRDENRGKDLDTDFAKIVLDGVPSVSRTAAMLQDYMPIHPGAPTTKGLLLYTQDQLDHMMAALDADGMTVKVHAAGDRSARAVLNAIEYTRKKNGNSGLRHEIAHAGFVDPTDIPRFVKLNAVAEISPYIWFPSVKTESIIRAVGNRAEHYWPVRTMLQDGVNVVAGSDWPAGALPDMNPWVGMEGLISRRNPWGAFPGVLWKEQAITLEQALKIYTVNGARALKLGNVTGSIETGKSADMIVLDQNLFDIPVDRISDTKVEMTLFEGHVVYRPKEPDQGSVN